MLLEGWGRYPRHESKPLAARAGLHELGHLVSQHQGLVARGNGRAYGDAAIGEDATLLMRGLDRMKAFAEEACLLTVEGGVLLGDIIESFLPRGFFLPVIPGTKFVSVGGAIAADVHGKNHHRDGGFGATVHSLRLVLPSGQTVTCSPSENGELFRATIGGMGLTGAIAEATIRLRRVETSFIRQQTTVAPNLSAALAALDAADEVTYSVAWIDCLAGGAALGRSLIYAGEHALAEEMVDGKERLAVAASKRLSVPVDLPGWTLNRASVMAFNELYFRRGSAAGREHTLVQYEPYFFPLDGVGQWNRIYGKRGFLQHQCVVPPDNAEAVLSEILARFARSGKASFLAVLKKLGEGSGMLSFPMRGYTLALDVQVSEEIFPLLDEIDSLVTRAGGRLYLAKDARQSRATFEQGYPELEAFRQVRRSIGAEGHITSKLSRRLGI